MLTPLSGYLVPGQTFMEARYWDLVHPQRKDGDPPEEQADKIKTKILKELEGEE